MLHNGLQETRLLGAAAERLTECDRPVKGVGQTLLARGQKEVADVQLFRLAAGRHVADNELIPLARQLFEQRRDLLGRMDGKNVNVRTKKLIDAPCARCDVWKAHERLAPADIFGQLDGAHAVAAAAHRAGILFIEADAVVGTVRRVGAVAVGVGVAQTKDMFFHRLFPFQISPRDWRK